jgi:competence protein ComEC
MRRAVGQRTMSSLAAGLLAGILVPLALPMGWQSVGLAALVVVALLAAATGWRALGLALVAGFLLGHFAAMRVLAAPYDCGERRLVTARIDSIPAPLGSGWQYDAWVAPADAPGQSAVHVRVSDVASIAPRSGERWQLLLQFDSPANGQTAAARRRALLRDHVTATARVRESALNRLLAPAAPSLDGLRLAVADRILSRVPDPSAAALLAALAVGVTGDVSTLQWRIFSATGITHLVAISGMHVTFFALLCMGVARLLWRRLAWLGAHCRRESFAALVGVVLAFAYALLSGYSVPAQRTALMLTTFLAARGCCRHVAPTWSVAAALVAVLVFDPLAVLAAGFWLSFGAVASIILLAGGRLHPPGALRAAALVQWVVTVALLPITAVLFGSFSAVGPLVNAAAIPLFTFALVPPVLVATVLYMLPLEASRWCADHLVDVAAWAAQQSWPWLVRAADLPGASLGIDAQGLWVLLAVPAVVCVLAPVAVPLRLGAMALLCSGFVARDPRPDPGSLQLVLFDVGASRAVLLRTARHQLLLGAGESFGTRGRRFEREVLPELLRGGGTLDIVLDRADRDSLQALAMARSRLPLRQVIAGSGVIPPELGSCTDDSWQWDQVRFTRRGTSDGCWLAVRVGAQLLVVAPPRMPSGVIPDFGPASLQVLPRSGRDAAVLMTEDAPGALALASVSSGEWQSGAWRTARASLSEGRALWSTANLGNVHLLLAPRGLARGAGQGGSAGIWSAAGAACAAP